MNWENMNTIQDVVDFCKENYGKDVTCGDVRNACEAIFFSTHREISEDDIMIELGIGE